MQIHRLLAVVLFAFLQSRAMPLDAAGSKLRTTMTVTLGTCTSREGCTLQVEFKNLGSDFRTLEDKLPWGNRYSMLLVVARDNHTGDVLEPTWDISDIRYQPIQVRRNQILKGT